MDTPQVSVVMATHNDIPFLSLAVDSILNQSFTNFELIIVDDASEDETKKLLDRYTDSRIVRITNQENIGLTCSLIEGVSCAKGDFIARQDADDISLPGRLEQQVRILLEHSQVGLVGCSYDWIDDNGNVLDSVIFPAQSMELRRELETGNIFAHGTVMFMRECLEKVGNYRSFFLAAQDMDLWQRIATSFEVGAIPDTLYQARIRYSGISGVRNLRRQLAYHRLSNQLMNERITLGREVTPTPTDVMATFPPENSELVKRLQYLAFLLYSGGQLKQASEALKDFTAILRKENVYGVDNLQDWTSLRAISISNKSGLVKEGVEFINWVFKEGSSDENNGLARKTLALFYADRAFWAELKRSKNEVLLYSLQAIKNDFNWLCNRGLLSISMKALWVL